MSYQLYFSLHYPAWRSRRSTLQRWAGKAAFAALEHQQVPPGAELSLRCSDDAALQALNSEFRHKDRPTNILSFPSGEEGSYLGDMALSLDTLAREAEEQGKELKAHFQHLVVHSVLHLLGFDHESGPEAEVMESMEINILQLLKINNPYLL